MSMSSFTNNRFRAISAKPIMRPKSGKNISIRMKTDHTGSVSSNQLPNPLSKFFSMRPGTESGLNVSKMMPPSQKISKDREGLFEENLILKKQINRLKEQISRNRTKMENIAAKNQDYTKKLNREFEKKIYWGGSNNYLISGIKSQYDKLKDEFEEKQSQCEQLKRQLYSSGEAEIRIYAETLEEQNKKLIDRVKKMAQISEEIVFEEKSKTFSEYEYHELKSKQRELQTKLQKRKESLRKYRGRISELEKKIEFLQKLIIQKDNALYYQTKKVKKLQKQKNEYFDISRNLQVRIQQISQKSDTRLKKLKEVEEKKFEQEKQIFQRTLFEKQKTIDDFRKEVAYLSTLLTYWKPLDELDKIVGNSSLQKQESFMNHNFDLREEDQTMKHSLVLNKNDSDGRISLSHTDKKIQKQSSSQILLPVEKQAESNRIQKTANMKLSDRAQKRRKVNLREIKHIGQYLKYRMMGLKLDIKAIKNFFSCHAQNASSWDQQYISMKEAKCILRSEPFLLDEQDSFLLARYLIQQSETQFVYCEQENQNLRNIVKSIMKSLLGNYDVLTLQKQQEVQNQCKLILEKYSSNLVSALSVMNETGLVSAKKFMELFGSLGIQISEEAIDHFISRMLLKSKSLNELDYMVVF